jgi:hypothetical protein
MYRHSLRDNIIIQNNKKYIKELEEYNNITQQLQDNLLARKYLYNIFKIIIIMYLLIIINVYINHF